MPQAFSGKQPFSSRSLAAVTLALLWLTPSLSLAQQPPSSGVHPKPSGEHALNDVLANDARLNRLITLHRHKSLVKETLQLLRDMSLVPLQIEDNPNSEVGVIALSYRYKDVPLRDVLDSIATLHHLEWKRKDKTLILCSRHTDHSLDIYRPHTEAEAVVFEQGRKVLDWFNKQSPEVQQQLQHPPMPGPQNPLTGFSFNSLPAPMQEAVNTMTSAVRGEQAALGAAILPPDDLSKSVLRLHQSPDQNGVQQFEIRLYDGHTSYPLSFNILPGSGNQEEPVVPLSEVPGKWYGDKQAETSRREALQADPRLNAPVTLKGTRLTLAEAVNQVGLQAPLSFTADNWEPDPVRKTFAFVDMPLKDVLDRLGVLYAFTWGNPPNDHFCYTWGRRKSGVFLFYTVPNNQATATAGKERHSANPANKTP